MHQRDAGDPGLGKCPGAITRHGGVDDGVGDAVRGKRLGQRVDRRGIAVGAIDRGGAFEVGLQHAGAQQDRTHVLAKIDQFAHEVQGEVLGAMRVSVMGHHGDACLLRRLFHPLDHVSHRRDGIARQSIASGLQERVAMAAIRLEIGAFGPFVPRVDEHHALAAHRMPVRIADRFGQPLPIARRRGVVERVAGAGFPRLVVPAREDPAEHRVIGQRPLDGGVDQTGVVHHVAAVVVALELQLFVAMRQPAGQFVRRKLDGHVEAERGGILHVELDHPQHDFADAVLAAVAPPAFGSRARIGQQRGPVDDHQGTTIDADVSRIGDQRDQVGDETLVIGLGMVLADQDILVLPIPAPGPVLVRPADAEREIDAGADELLQRPLQQAATREPVVMECESVQAVTARQFDLAVHHLRHAQVVITELAWQSRLVVAGELRQRLANVGPFRESAAPPRVVFSDGMELGQIEGDRLGCHRVRGAHALVGRHISRACRGCRTPLGHLGHQPLVQRRRTGARAGIDRRMRGDVQRRNTVMDAPPGVRIGRRKGPWKAGEQPALQSALGSAREWQPVVRILDASGHALAERLCHRR